MSYLERKNKSRKRLTSVVELKSWNLQDLTALEFALKGQLQIQAIQMKEVYN
jgi:hypothetical protein